MVYSEAARRYAKALYELAKDKGIHEKVFSELRVLDAAIEAEQSIAEFLSSPLTPPDQKIAALKGALHGKIQDETVHFLLLLAEKNRLSLFSEILSSYEAISDADHGVTRGIVRSATALSPEARARIEQNVNKVTGKKVILSFKEDSSILGGMVAQVGGWTFDDSLESHLKRLSEELNRRAN